MSEEQNFFKTVDYKVGGLLYSIDLGDIALPDIQRPFVWNAAKVRDLFDSMYRGFPVGYLLFWSNGQAEQGRQIGQDEKAHEAPSLFIIDGQQRLTSLYAIFRGKPVKNKDFRMAKIEIAFRPRDGRFAVCDAAIRKDPEFIPSISELFTSGKSGFSLVTDFLKRLETRKDLTEEERDRMSHNFERLLSLSNYPFTAVEISSALDEEHVAEIFVRINSKQVRLSQADFILTLLSVFWDEGRADLEDFCLRSRKPPVKGDQPSPYNQFIQPGPDQMLKVAIALGFFRARLKAVYQVLLGKEIDTGRYSAERRETQLKYLAQAQVTTLNLTHWHQFFTCLVGAGFRSGELISSRVALLYSYAFYLIGKTKYGVKESVLQRLIGRWFYCVSFSGRYVGSAESSMDADLSRIKNPAGPESFVQTIEGIISDTLTGDFWAITLPNELETSSARSPSDHLRQASYAKCSVRTTVFCRISQEVKGFATASSVASQK